MHYYFFDLVHDQRYQHHASDVSQLLERIFANRRDDHHAMELSLVCVVLVNKVCDVQIRSLSFDQQAQLGAWTILHGP